VRRCAGIGAGQEQPAMPLRVHQRRRNQCHDGGAARLSLKRNDQFRVGLLLNIFWSVLRKSSCHTCVFLTGTNMASKCGAITARSCSGLTRAHVAQARQQELNERGFGSTTNWPVSHRLTISTFTARHTWASACWNFGP
jgi:hypothetical protein